MYHFTCHKPCHFKTKPLTGPSRNTDLVQAVGGAIMPGGAAIRWWHRSLVRSVRKCHDRQNFAQLSLVVPYFGVQLHFAYLRRIKRVFSLEIKATQLPGV